MDIVDRIVHTIQSDFNGRVDCEKERADLYVYLNGNEVGIDSIDTERIQFSNGESVCLLDADIQHLSYIHDILTQ